MVPPHGFNLPQFPWDTLSQVTALAQSYTGGAVDLTIGSPVDAVGASTQSALAKAADAHGYPPAIGSEALRARIAEFMTDVRGASRLDASNVVLTIGSKELVASLALQLGVGPGDAVGFPEVAYPTYEVGAILAHATPLPLGPEPQSWPTGKDAPKLVWINSPGNPHGHTYDIDALRRAVAWARQNSAILVSDECYALLDWEGAPRGSGLGTPSLLDAKVTDGDNTGLLVTHSLSKQNNLAGYRAAWVCGDGKLIADVREVRKHWGLMVPGPVQAAEMAALDDRETPLLQKETYRVRREKLLKACVEAGLENDPLSVAGLYLWLRKPDIAEGRELARWFALRGIRVAPGEFYGPAGRTFVRVSLTASDAEIERACQRLHEGAKEFFD